MKKYWKLSQTWFALALAFFIAAGSFFGCAVSVPAAAVDGPLGLGLSIGEIVWNLYSAAGLTICDPNITNDSIFDMSLQSCIDRGLLRPADGVDMSGWEWDDVLNEVERMANDGESNFTKNDIIPVFEKMSPSSGGSGGGGWKDKLKQWLVAIGMSASIQASMVGGIQPVTDALMQWSQPMAEYHITAAQASDAQLLKGLSQAYSLLPEEFSYMTPVFSAYYPKNLDSFVIRFYDLSNCAIATYGDIQRGYYQYFAIRYFSGDAGVDWFYYQYCTLTDPKFRKGPSSSRLGTSYFPETGLIGLTILGNIPHFPDEDSAKAYLESLPSPLPVYFPGLIGRQGNLQKDQTIEPNIDPDKNWQPATQDQINNYITNQGDTINQGDVVNNYNTFVEEHTHINEIPVIPDVTPAPSGKPDVTPSVSPGLTPSVTPVLTPVPEEDMEKYAVDLTKVFPFCIPFDLVHLFNVLDAEPRAPSFEIPVDLEFSDPFSGRKLIDYHEKFEIDMEDYDTVVKIFRAFQIVMFIIGLILITRNLIRG